MALTLGDNFSYQGAKPLDARLKYDTLAAMKAVADATMYDGCLAYCVATDKTYQWKSTNTVDVTLGKWREFTSGGDTIQVSSMPVASESELGNVYQYIGSTTLVYTHGYFYECVSDGAGTPTYSWEEVSTSKGGHDIKNDGVAVTSRDTMNFTDFDIADDSTNEETDIKAHRLTSAEIADICTPLPSAVSDMPVLCDEAGSEYVVGWYKFSDGTKKPLYQKTLKDAITVSGSDKSIYVSNPISNIDDVVSVEGFINDNNKRSALPVGWDGSICYVSADATYLYVFRSDNSLAANKNITFVVKYTKTTDVAS